MAQKSYSSFDRLYALAAIHQCVALVDRIATSGSLMEGDAEIVIRGLFVMSPSCTIDVYGEAHQLNLGLKTICSQHDLDSSLNTNLINYMMRVVSIERKLSGNKEMLSELGKELEKVKRQIEHFSVLHTSVISRLDEIYQQTISTLQPRIIVKGDGAHLRRPENAKMVRALLLAAVRAAVLWRQCGGSRLQLFMRQKLAKEAKKIILEAKEE